MPAAAIPLVQQPHYIEPASTISAVPGGSGSSWGNGAWTELLASMPADAMLSGMNGVINTVLGLDSATEFDIGTGTAGNEVSVGTFKYHYKAIANDPLTNGLTWMPAIALMDVLASGDRVSCRHRWASTSTLNWRAVFGYLEKPIVGRTPLSTTAELKCYPTAAADITITTSSTPWQNTGYTEFRAAGGGDDWFITALIAHVPQGTTYSEFDLAEGTAGNEVVKYTVRIHEGNAGNFEGMRHPFQNPFLFEAGTRLSIRVRNSGNVAVIAHMAFNYFESLG
jgi:hypothetical protein